MTSYNRGLYLDDAIKSIDITVKFTENIDKNSVSNNIKFNKNVITQINLTGDNTLSFNVKPSPGINLIEIESVFELIKSKTCFLIPTFFILK